MYILKPFDGACSPPGSRLTFFDQFGQVEGWKERARVIRVVVKEARGRLKRI
jgi:hypothetical protein